MEDSTGVDARNEGIYDDRQHLVLSSIGRTPHTPAAAAPSLGQTTDEQVDWDAVEIDPSAVRLIEQTPLPQIHTMFSLLGIDEAYVTKLGRVIGVITLLDVRDAMLADARV